MVFSSLIFLSVYLPIVIMSYFIIPRKVKNLFFLLASLFFYAWGNTSYAIVLLISILINYRVGLDIQKLEGKAIWRRNVLALGIILNLSILVYYKYFNFIIHNFNRLFHTGFPVANIVLPIGISFFIFQGLSYIIDVYRRQVQADKSLLHIALYIAMFPQLVAGPIVQYKDIKEQLSYRRIDSASFSAGIQRFVMGLSKKVLIADVLGQTVDRIFAATAIGVDNPTAWLGILCYTLQIYFDFSGYSDMAIGLGRMFGFTYKENFNYPYISTSITEFWRRWHISLSSWFKEYLYIPLGGNRRGNVYLHLFIVFCATGIWHGAGFKFLFWGLWHGLFIILERVLMKGNRYDRIPGVLRWSYTFFTVMMGWVLFRSDSLSAAWQYFGYLFGWTATNTLQFTFLNYVDARLIFVLAIAFLGSVPMFTQLVQRYNESVTVAVVRIPTLLLQLTLCIVFIVNSNYSPFIYFQF